MARVSRKEKSSNEPVKNESSNARTIALMDAINQKMASSSFKVDKAVTLFTTRPNKMPSYSSGSMVLDETLGVGGFPIGRIVEIYGPESSGKTTLCLMTIAELHKTDPEAVAIYIDTEHALDPNYMRQLGVDFNRLFVSQPDTAEEAMELLKTSILTGQIKIAIVDSVAELTPRAEIEGDMGDAHVGLKARLMGQALRTVKSIANTNGVTVMFTNQIREKVGVLYGNPETTPGGQALKFAASIRARVSKVSGGEIRKGKEDAIGYKMRVKIIKNKVAPPGKECELSIYYGKGVSKETELIVLATGVGVITKSGAFYRYNDALIGQGLENASEYLVNNPDVTNAIRQEYQARASVYSVMDITPESDDDFDDDVANGYQIDPETGEILED